MNQQESLSRRGLLQGAGMAAAALTAGASAVQACTSCGCSAQKKSPLDFDNAMFYDASGTFKKDVAQDAYITLMTYHGYPVFDGIKDKLWVSDYGTGQFTKLGLGANMFVNNEEDRYMLMDLFLLPGQMLPEHYHLATDKNPAKMEGWLVRHGMSYVYGEGAATKPMKAVVPKCHMNGTVTVEHEVILKSGEFAKLNRVTSRHWQYGGPEGAIITETASVHDDNGVRHSDTNLVFPS